MKQCTKCKAYKPATAKHFSRDKRRRDGFDPHCKACKHAYYEANKTRLLAKALTNYTAKRQHKLEYVRRYRKENKEKVAEVKRRWAIVNHERVKVNAHARYIAIKEKQPERNRIGRASNQARKHNAQGSLTADDIQRQYQSQKGRCYYCNIEIGAKYTIDHVVPLSRGGSNGPENIVIACRSCNSAKGDKLPHEWPRGGRLL